MTKYYYHPDTGELIQTAAPADWMAATSVAPPAHDSSTEGCFWRNGAWVIVPGGDPAKKLADFQASAKDALAATSVTMERIVEGISLGTTTATAPDVVAWMNYRKALRACITATVAGTLPNKPPYPAGT